MGSQREHRIPTGPQAQFWLVPVTFAVGAIGLGIGVTALDHAFPDLSAPMLFQGPSSAARSTLNAIVTAMISMTGMVFSLAFVAVQLSSGQYSPRVVQMYMGDRIIQVTFGVFTATFMYAIVVEQAVKPDERVPRLAVSVGGALVFASAVLFMIYVGRVAYMMRASTIIAEIGDVSTAVLERRYPRDAGPPGKVGDLPEPHRVVESPRRGLLVTIDEAAVAKHAARAGCVVALQPRLGDFVTAGAPLFTVHGGSGDVDGVVEQARKRIKFGTERTMQQDVAFGFRQLIDMIEKALSPSVNDPTTACQALDTLHDMLRRLATRPPVPEAVRAPDGQVRLVIPRYQFAELLNATVRETLRYGSDAAQVPERIDRMLADLQDVARPEHREAVCELRAEVSA